MTNYQSLADALSDLKKKGYEENFESQTYCLYCGDLDLRLDPEDFHVDEIYHIEGNAGSENPNVYAISSVTGVKGIIIDANSK